MQVFGPFFFRVESDFGGLALFLDGVDFFLIEVCPPCARTHVVIFMVVWVGDISSPSVNGDLPLPELLGCFWSPVEFLQSSEAALEGPVRNSLSDLPSVELAEVNATNTGEDKEDAIIALGFYGAGDFLELLERDPIPSILREGHSESTGCPRLLPRNGGEEGLLLPRASENGLQAEEFSKNY